MNALAKFEKHFQTKPALLETALLAPASDPHYALALGIVHPEADQ